MNTLMDEYACRFFLMVEQSSRLDASDVLDNIQSSSVPHLKQNDAKSVISSYKKLALPPVSDKPDKPFKSRLKPKD